MTIFIITILVYFGVSLITSFIYNEFLWKDYMYYDDRSASECFLPFLAVWRITSEEVNLPGRILLSTFAQIFLMVDTIMYSLLTVVVIIACLLAALFEFLFKKKDN